MARPRSNVPKFGDWEQEGAVPYTVYFEKARQARGAEKMTAQPGSAVPLSPPTRPAPETAPRTPRARPTTNGGSSHSSEGRNARQPRNGRGFAPTSPGPKPVTYADDLDHDSAVPKFGEWNDGKGDENYTEKFNNFRKDRKEGATASPYPGGGQRAVRGESKKEAICCCFPWTPK